MLDLGATLSPTNTAGRVLIPMRMEMNVNGPR